MKHLSDHKSLRAYTLLEIMVVLAILVAAAVGVMRFFAHDTAKASIQKEQGNLSSLVRGVQGMFASKNSFAGITSAEVAGARLSGVPVSPDGTRLMSAFGTPVTVQPATVVIPNDAFSVVYSGLGAKDCAALIPAVAGEAYAISIAGGASVVSTNPISLGKVSDPAVVTSQCAGPTFAKNAGSVLLTFYKNSRAPAGGPVAPPGCTVSCSPQTETQDLACPVGQSGAVHQVRNNTCSAAACPVPVIGPWTTTSSSCAPAPVTPPPVVVPPPIITDPGTGACVPATTTRNQFCPPGQAGVIVESQSLLCPSGTRTPWTQTSNSCVAIVTPTCSATTKIQNLACPAGQFGQITQNQNYSCDANGNQVADGPWYTVSNNCTTIGTCRPSTRPAGQKTVSCSPGQYGQIIQDLEQSSTCPTATSLPVWGPTVVVSSTGTCQNCPGSATTTQTQWVARSAACPSGQTGSNTWEQQQTRSQTTSYACAGAPTTLPAPTVSAWSAWSDVSGVTRNAVNTCAAAPSCDGVQNGPFMGWADLSSTDLGDTYCPAPASGRVSGTPSINATCSSFSDLGNTYDDEQWRETWDYDGANGTGNYVCMSATGVRTHNACKQYCSHMNKLCNTTAGVTHCNANPQFNFSGDINQIIALGHDAAWWIKKTYCQNYWDPGNSSLPRPQTSASVDVNLSFGGQTIPVVMSCNGGDNNPAEKNWCSVTKPFSVGGASYTVTLRVGASLPSDQSPTYITQTCIDIN